MKKLLTFGLLFMGSCLLYGMRPAQSSKYGSQEVVIPLGKQYCKLHIEGGEWNLLNPLEPIPAGKIVGNTIYVDLNAIDRFSKQSFNALLHEKKVLILAVLHTGSRGSDRTWQIYEANGFNTYFAAKQRKEFSKLSLCEMKKLHATVKDPNTQALLGSEIRYFVIREGNNQCDFLGTMKDYFSDIVFKKEMDKKLNGDHEYQSLVLRPSLAGAASATGDQYSAPALHEDCPMAAAALDDKPPKPKHGDVSLQEKYLLEDAKKVQAELVLLERDIRDFRALRARLISPDSKFKEDLRKKEQELMDRKTQLLRRKDDILRRKKELDQSV